MYRQHRLREIGLRRGVSRDKNGLRRGLAGLNRTWTFDPCTPCLKFCTPTFKILPNSLGGGDNNKYVMVPHTALQHINNFWCRNHGHSLPLSRGQNSSTFQGLNFRIQQLFEWGQINFWQMYVLFPIYPKMRYQIVCGSPMCACVSELTKTLSFLPRTWLNSIRTTRESEIQRHITAKTCFVPGI